MEVVRGYLGRQEHAIPMERRRVAHEVRVLLRGLQVAEIEWQLVVSNGG